MSDTRLESVFGNDYRIIKLFLEGPEEEITLTEAVNELRISKMTLYRVLEKLVKKKILISRSDNYRNFYRLKESHLNKALKMLTNLESRVIHQFLKEIKDDSIILLYGSRADGTNRKDSDWDILVISNDLNTLEVNKRAAKIGRKYACEINVNTLSNRQFHKIRKDNTPFYLEVMQNKYVLRGDLNEITLPLKGSTKGYNG